MVPNFCGLSSTNYYLFVFIGVLNKKMFNLDCYQSKIILLK